MYMRTAPKESFSTCFNASVFGKISPNSKIRKVTIPVDIPIANQASHPEDSAKSILIFVAKEAAVRFTILFPIKIVTSSLSLLVFKRLRRSAVSFHFLIQALIL